MSTSTQSHAFFQNIGGLIESIQPESIISRTVYSDTQIKVVLFGFDKGQALSEHTASQPATIQILQGEATITVAEDTLAASVGTWIHMPPNTKHSVVATTSLILLLTLLRTSSEGG